MKGTVPYLHKYQYKNENNISKTCPLSKPTTKKILYILVNIYIFRVNNNLYHRNNYSVL